MLVPLLVLSRVLLGKRTLAISLDLSLFVLPIFDLGVVRGICVDEVFRGGFGPLALILVCLLRGNFFLLHKVEIETAFDDHFNEEILPVLEQDLELLLQVLQVFLALLLLVRSQGYQHKFLSIVLEWFFKETEEVDGRCGHFSVEVEGQHGCEVIGEVEGVFDLVADVGRTVISDEPVETVIDDILPPALLLLTLLTTRLAAHHLWLHLNRFLILVTHLQILLELVNSDEIGEEVVNRHFLPCLLPRVNINGHRDEGFEDRPGTFFILGEDDEDEAKLVALSKGRSTSWLKEVSENFKLLKRATPFAPISFRVSPSRVTSWMKNSTILRMGYPEVISQ